MQQNWFIKSAKCKKTSSNRISWAVAQLIAQYQSVQAIQMCQILRKRKTLSIIHLMSCYQSSTWPLVSSNLQTKYHCTWMLLTRSLTGRSTKWHRLLPRYRRVMWLKMQPFVSKNRCLILTISRAPQCSVHHLETTMMSPRIGLAITSSPSENHPSEIQIFNGPKVLRQPSLQLKRPSATPKSTFSVWLMRSKLSQTNMSG